jgi:hypothetical protein
VGRSETRQAPPPDRLTAFGGHFPGDKVGGCDDEAALQVTAKDQLVDPKPHDGLAGARGVGGQEAQRLPREQLNVDRCDLVRQRIDP